MRKRNRNWAIGGIIALSLVIGISLGWRRLAIYFFGFTTARARQNIQTSNGGVTFGWDGPLQPDGLPQPWESRVIVGSLNSSVINDIEQGKSQDLVCDGSHVVVWYAAAPFAASTHPIIAWSWKALALPMRGDTRTHAAFPLLSSNRNDKALQVMVGFEGDLVLNYVWDANAPMGYECDEWSPVAKVKTRVVDSGAAGLGQWVHHEIDVQADFIRRFGKAPGKILGVGISANTNHTSARGEALFSAIHALPALHGKDGKAL
jgi:hypothetical protein